MLTFTLLNQPYIENSGEALWAYYTTRFQFDSHNLKQLSYIKPLSLISLEKSHQNKGFSGFILYMQTGK